MIHTRFGYNEARKTRAYFAIGYVDTLQSIQIMFLISWECCRQEMNTKPVGIEFSAVNSE
jgi:hypothetical protein